MAFPAERATTPTLVRGRFSWNFRMNRFATAMRRLGGFTLIELLVVLMIMGLLVGLISVSVRPDDRGLLRVEAERLAQLLDLAVAESRLAGRPMAWTADATRYRFWRMTGEGEWSEVRDSELLRPRTLPRDMMIAGLQIEHAPVSGAMRLEFSPYGLNRIFAVDMVLGAARWTVAASPIGEVRVLSDEGAANASRSSP
jgi:general secretion pathway protein H